ncbi:MAG: hypothetical protein AB8F95_05790 [Bacteroidia bacterium]
MKKLLNILKWIVIIILFPWSFLYIAYRRQRRAIKSYSDKGDSESPS